MATKKLPRLEYIYTVKVEVVGCLAMVDGSAAISLFAFCLPVPARRPAHTPFFLVPSMVAAGTGQPRPRAPNRRPQGHPVRADGQSRITRTPPSDHAPCHRGHG